MCIFCSKFGGLFNHEGENLYEENAVDGHVPGDGVVPGDGSKDFPNHGEVTSEVGGFTNILHLSCES